MAVKELKNVPDYPYFELEEIKPEYYSAYELDPKIKWFWLFRVCVPAGMRSMGWGSILVEQAQEQIHQGAGILCRARPYNEKLENDDRPESIERLMRLYAKNGFTQHPLLPKGYMLWVKN